jgi:GntR family transcriptional regulator
MPLQLSLKVDAQSPIPIRRQLAEQLKHVIEGGSVPHDQPLPSIRELAGFLGINPNTVARVIEDLQRSGYVEARRGKGVFVAPVLPARPSPTLRQKFLQDTVIQAAARGMTADDVAVGVLSLADIRPSAVQGAVEILLVECSGPELEFFARELSAQLPVRVDKVLLGELATIMRGTKRAGRWGVPVIALLAEAHLETLHRLAQLPAGTRVGVASAAAETAHNLEHSIANAGLPNITLIGACPAEGAALGRLVRRVDVMVCSSSAAGRVRGLADSSLQVMIDDRAVDRRAIEMLAAVLVRHSGDGTAAAPPGARGRLHPPSSDGRTPPGGAARAAAKRRGAGRRRGVTEEGA